MEVEIATLSVSYDHFLHTSWAISVVKSCFSNWPSLVRLQLFYNRTTYLCVIFLLPLRLGSLLVFGLRIEVYSYIFKWFSFWFHDCCVIWEDGVLYSRSLVVSVALLCYIDYLLSIVMGYVAYIYFVRSIHFSLFIELPINFALFVRIRAFDRVLSQISYIFSLNVWLVRCGKVTKVSLGWR